MPLEALLPASKPQFRRDLTVAVVCCTSWAAVAWKMVAATGRGGAADGGAAAHAAAGTAAPGGALEALLALGAALLCLWPLPLGLASQATYQRWREWLVPAHLAAQHWVGLRFVLPAHSQQAMATPAWARNMLPIFLATFCQPWMYLRTRLRHFLWTQPLLLAPMLLAGRSHCVALLAGSPEAAGHLQRITVAMQRTAAWLPLGSAAVRRMSDPASLGGCAAAVAPPPDPAAICLGVHLWLIVLLAFCLPAIVIHRLEGQERQAVEHTRKQRRRNGSGDGGGGGASGSGGAAAARLAANGSRAIGAESGKRDLLLQQPQSVLRSSAELALAGYAAWLAVQLALAVLPL